VVNSFELQLVRSLILRVLLIQALSKININDAWSEISYLVTYFECGSYSYLDPVIFFFHLVPNQENVTYTLTSHMSSLNRA
jgi:hypothetical protein